MDLIYNGATNTREERKEPYATIEIETEEDFKYLHEMITAKHDGRLVILPCKVGDVVYAIGNCEDVAIQADDDYFFGTGFSECPFEESCDYEDCGGNHVRIFETVVTDFWFGGSNRNSIEMFLEHINRGYTDFDVGKNVFFDPESAKQELKEREENVVD